MYTCSCSAISYCCIVLYCTNNWSLTFVRKSCSLRVYWLSAQRHLEKLCTPKIKRSVYLGLPKTRKFGMSDPHADACTCHEHTHAVACWCSLTHTYTLPGNCKHVFGSSVSFDWAKNRSNTPPRRQENDINTWYNDILFIMLRSPPRWALGTSTHKVDVQIVYVSGLPTQI